MNKWFASFGTVHTWVSDKGTHFVNDTISEIAHLTKTHHHFTLAYCPWTNGTVEVVCRELLRATRAILHEFQLPATMWRTTISMVQGALNNCKLKSLNNKCPLELFTGHRQYSPVTAIATKVKGATVVHSLSDTRLDGIMKTLSMHDKLEDMHRDIEKSTSRRRKNAIEAHNRRTNIRPVNFTTGDYVLLG